LVINATSERLIRKARIQRFTNQFEGVHWLNNVEKPRYLLMLLARAGSKFISLPPCFDDSPFKISNLFHNETELRQGCLKVLVGTQDV